MTAPMITTDVCAYNFNLEINNFLTQLKNDPSSSCGKSFLHELAREGDTLSAEVLIQAGANADLPDEEGRRPLHEAAFFGHLDMIDMLLRYGVLLDAPIHPFGFTALFLAVQQGRHETVHYLLEHGARVSVEDVLSGQGLLHIAAMNNDIKMLGLLIAAGANVFHEDRRGQTARDYARKYDFASLEKVLLKLMEHHARYGA